MWIHIIFLLLLLVKDINVKQKLEQRKIKKKMKKNSLWYIFLLFRKSNDLCFQSKGAGFCLLQGFPFLHYQFFRILGKFLVLLKIHHSIFPCPFKSTVWVCLFFLCVLCIYVAQNPKSKSVYGIYIEREWERKIHFFLMFKGQNLIKN